MSRVQNQHAYERLRRLLIHGQIRPGIRVVEAQWARQLGVGRPALREAMMVLAHEGLLRRGERGGYFVPILEQTDFDQIMEVRRIIEVGAIRIIGERPPDEEENARLTAVCDTMEQMLGHSLELGFAEADRRFHRVLVELSGNDRLIQLYEQAPLPLFVQPALDPQVRIANGKTTIDEHRTIQQLLHQRRIPQAIEALESHLLASHRYVPLP
ncbi:MAG TPA: GntR family transcriptional regulator [Phycisphaeraceae bacterium]